MISGAGHWSLGTLWRGHRQGRWSTTDFRALYTGTGADGAEKAAWLGGLPNAVADARRA